MPTKTNAIAVTIPGIAWIVITSREMDFPVRDLVATTEMQNAIKVANSAVTVPTPSVLIMGCLKS